MRELLERTIREALYADLNPHPGIKLRADATRQTDVVMAAIAPFIDGLLALREAVVALDGMEDLSTCPYYSQDGTEGAYGPNTCSFSCVDEPQCQTWEPSDGWPLAIAIQISPTSSDAARVQEQDNNRHKEHDHV